MSSCTMRSCCVLVLLSGIVGVVRAAQEQKAMLAKEDAKARVLAAVEPFTDAARKAAKKVALAYEAEAGTVDKSGDVINVGDKKPGNKLDCSCFASAIVHRILNDSYKTFDVKIQRGWGDEIAKAYKLKEAYRKSVKDALAELSSGSLPVGVYFFDIRDAAGKKKEKSGNGHVGILIVEGTAKDQAVTQIHMSSTNAATDKEGGGLANNKKFREFVTGTAYGRDEDKQAASELTLYTIP